MNLPARVVVKVGSSSLTRPDGTLNRDRLSLIANQLADCYEAGSKVALVSSGAVAAGVGVLDLPGKPTDVAGHQAAAMVGQSRLMSVYTEEFVGRGITIGQVLLTADDVMRRSHYSNARNALTQLLDMGVVPIVNENDAVATHELRLGDNDRLAALVAHLTRADMMVLLTDVDGLYTGPPSQPGSVKVDVVRDIRELEKYRLTGRGSDMGTGGMVTKVRAARMASAFGIPTVITSADSFGDLIAGKRVGTRFEPTGKRGGARDMWIVHAARIRGVLTIDDGAQEVLRRGGVSLLAVGVTAVSGTFGIGDAVEIRTRGGDLLARGLSGWDSVELAENLGVAGAGRPAVHADDLVLIRN